MQLGGVLSTSHVANSFMGTGLRPDEPEKGPDEPPMFWPPDPPMVMPRALGPAPVAAGLPVMPPTPGFAGLQPPIALAITMDTSVSAIWPSFQSLTLSHYYNKTAFDFSTFRKSSRLREVRQTTGFFECSRLQRKKGRLRRAAASAQRSVSYGLYSPRLGCLSIKTESVFFFSLYFDCDVTKNI